MSELLASQGRRTSGKKPQADFEYIGALIEEFFHQRNVRATLQAVSNHGITGWEVWAQVEFARFLAEHVTEPYWEREAQIEFDYRREKERYFFRPDFIIRKKYWALDRYVALEIKQHQQPGNCITNMISDLTKVAKMRRSELNVRSLWALGVFYTDNDLDVFEMIEEKLTDSDLKYFKSRTTVRRIAGTDFSYALF
ncbi:hypothetical protein ACM7LX_27270 [Pseudomonas aeruginosa]|uniref:hypothetical protein n=1 Tax=Pseudomonas aeruginosa TaxID=287 RepID=UPI00155275C6|nr:hypothetical protein [Pseudomonas aeruginosa]QKF01654.1 hypothetical protein HPT09_09795 [Pseudomonas aeruginosa]HCF1525194.1 hypothetical protein [Pseudomonas aeruginosa]